MRHIERRELIWDRTPAAPIALILLPTWCGVTIAQLDGNGRVYGCRDVEGAPGDPHYDRVVSAWIEGERELGRAIDDRRLTEPTPAGPQRVIPGAGPQVAELIRRRASAPLKPSKPQAACDVGLFSDDSAQLDLVDLARKV